MTAAQIAMQLRGRRLRTGGFICRCPLPYHGQGRGDLEPSLSIADGDRGPLVHCFAGCDPSDVLKHLRGLGLSADTRASVSPRTGHQNRDASSSEALQIWRSAIEIPGTPAERYLTVQRALHAPYPPSLRFSPDTVHPRFARAMPALVAAIESADETVIAVQVTWLTADGRKAFPYRPRWNFGRLGSGAVRLGTATSVVGIAEGVEDALAAYQLTGIPCWASLGAARLHQVAVPTEVREVHVFADDDDPGRKAAERVCTKHIKLGRAVIVRLPPEPHKDWAAFAKGAGPLRRVA